MLRNLKRLLAPLAVAAFGLVAAPAAGATSGESGCPTGGQWVGPLTTLQAATWYTASYGGSVESIDGLLQARADKNGDTFICYKLMAQDRLPEPAQEHNSGAVVFTDATASRR